MQMLLPLMYTLLFSFSLSPYPQPMEFRNNSPCTVLTNSLFLGAVDLSGNGLQGSPLLWQLLLKDRSWHPAAMSIFCPYFCSWPHNQSGLLVDPTDFFSLPGARKTCLRTEDLSHLDIKARERRLMGFVLPQIVLHGLMTSAFFRIQQVTLALQVSSLSVFVSQFLLLASQGTWTSIRYPISYLPAGIVPWQSGANINQIPQISGEKYYIFEDPFQFARRLSTKLDSCSVLPTSSL